MDASHQGLAAVLSQDLGSGAQVIAYASRGHRGQPMPVMDTRAMRRGCRTTAHSSWVCWVSSGLSVKSSAAFDGERTSQYSQITAPCATLISPNFELQSSEGMAELAAYNFSVKWRPAKGNRNAGAFSRYPAQMPDHEDPVSNRPPKSQLLPVVASATIANQQILPDQDDFIRPL